MKKLTKYQKWICQPGNDKHFKEYIYKRIVNGASIELKSLLDTRKSAPCSPCSCINTRARAKTYELLKIETTLNP